MNRFYQNLITYGNQILEGFKKLRNLTLSQLRKVFSLMGRREKIALLLLLAIALGNFYLSARNFYYSRTAAAPASGGQYIEGMLGQPGYINPLLANSETEMALTKLVFSGLYKYNAAGELTPDLAEGMPEISPDQKQYAISLKKNLKWHNGAALTADDVIYTVQTLQNEASKSPLRPLWLSTNVEKLSDYQVKFTTKDISGPFIQNLTLPIIPKVLWSRVNPQNFLLSKLNLEAVGAGPYSIKEIKKLPSGKVQSIALDAFSDYHLGRPQIDQIIIKFYDAEEDVLNALHSKEISGFGFVPLGSSLYLEQDQQNLQIFTTPLPQYQVAFFNLSNKILAEQNVRTALALATDRRQIIEEVFKNKALMPASPLLFANQAQNSPALEYNPEKAKQMLDAGGWKIDPKSNLRQKKNLLLEFTVTTNDQLPNAKAAEILAGQWRSLNIKVNLSLFPTNQLTDSAIRSRNFDVLLFPQKFSADPDPFLFWHSSQIKDPGFNLTGFASQNADKLITQARATTNRQIREEKYAEFDKMIVAAAPIIFLDQTVYVYAIDKNIKNVNLQTLYEPSQRFYDLPNWYMEEKRVWK